MGTQVFGIAEVLRMAQDMAQARPTVSPTKLDVQVLGLHGTSVAIAGGTVVSTRKPKGAYDILVVPGMEITHHVVWNRTLAALDLESAYIRRSFAGGTPVASVCIGAFLLGEAGVLDGRRATTAWLLGPTLSRRYPHIQLEANAILVEDAGVVTTGAVSSAFDLAYHLVKHTLGADIAAAVARVSLLPFDRKSQAPYVDARLMPPTRLPGFSQQVEQWLLDRMDQPFQLNALAQAFLVSPSTLLRRVKSETGNTPLDLLQRARIERAKQLLDDSSQSVAQIISAVGYEDVASFSRLFGRLVGMSPSRYRKRLQ